MLCVADRGVDGEMDIPLRMGNIGNVARGNLLVGDDHSPRKHLLVNGWKKGVGDSMVNLHCTSISTVSINTTELLAIRDQTAPLVLPPRLGARIDLNDVASTGE